MIFLVYLDNAATSFPKPERVYTEMDRCMRTFCANPGRGGHSLALESGRAELKTREALADFFNCSNPMEMVFAFNATHAINIALKGVLKPGQHVITTSMEHNSVVRPLMEMKKKGIIDVSAVKCDKLGNLDPYYIKKEIRLNTALVVCTYSSNVNGTIMPVREIGRLTRERGILFMVDASQGAGSCPIDVRAFQIDLLAFPGHKGLLGPQGTGGLFIREGLKLNSLIEGGTGSNSENIYQPDIIPDKFESGTVNLPGIVGLECGIGFISNMGIKNLQVYKRQLVKRLIEGIRDIDSIIIYSHDEMNRNSGVVAVNIDGVDSVDVSYILDKKYGICTRAGQHCAPLAHETLGTKESGVVRFSPGCFNTLEEIDYTIKAMQEIAIAVKAD